MFNLAKKNDLCKYISVYIYIYIYISGIPGAPKKGYLF